MRPNKEVFAKLGKKYDAGITVVVYCHGPTGPALLFERSTLEELVALGASLEIDLYSLKDEAPDPG